MNVLKSSSRYNCICVKGGSSASTTAGSAVTTTGSECSEDKCVESCEQGWEKNGDHCYLWGTDKKNWNDAEDFCQKEGGHLASVTSNATRDFVVEGMNRTGLDSAWIGGNDIEEKGVWEWTDCTPWEVTFWAPGEPNGPGGECLDHVFKHPVIKSGNWNDRNCGSEIGFLCSKKICSGKSYQKKFLSVPAVISGSLFGFGGCR